MPVISIAQLYADLETVTKERALLAKENTRLNARRQQLVERLMKMRKELQERRKPRVSIHVGTCYKYESVEHLPVPDGITVERDSYTNEITGFFKNGRRICATKIRNKPLFCKRYTVKGYDRCYRHGGRKMTSPSLKHALYSRYLPDNLLPRFQVALDDPNLVSLRQNLALTDIRITQLLERLNAGDTIEYWQQLQSWFARFDSVEEEEDRLQLLREIRPLIKQAIDDYKVWQQIYVANDEKRKMAEAERRRLLDMQQYITVERAMLLISAISEIVRKNIDDPDTLERVAVGIKQLVVNDAGRAPSS